MVKVIILKRYDTILSADMLRILTDFINFANENIEFDNTKLIKNIGNIMALEIEHKYLVKNDGFKSLSSDSIRILQGYLCRDPERTVRVRIKGNRGYLTVKGKNEGSIRQEFEYEIGIKDASDMLAMCIPPILEKIRHIVPYDGHIWEVDEFMGEKAGLVTAEIELKSADEEYEIPRFIGEDVTGDPSYYNSNLC